jgi:hypothetical protein
VTGILCLEHYDFCSSLKIRNTFRAYTKRVP